MEQAARGGIDPDSATKTLTEYGHTVMELGVTLLQGPAELGRRGLVGREGVCPGRGRRLGRRLRERR